MKIERILIRREMTSPLLPPPDGHPVALFRWAFALFATGIVAGLFALVHRWTGNIRPLGWDHQLRDEVGVNLVYTQVWRTREFKTQRNHHNNFGSVTISRAF